MSTKTFVSRILFLLLFIATNYVLSQKPGDIFAQTTNTFYVSPSGSDTNNGTSPTTPFKTFAKSVTVMSAGSKLYILGGTYTEKLNITKSGTQLAPIEVMPYQNQTVVIDGTNSKTNLVDMLGSFINVSGLEVKNSSGYCVQITGSNNTFSNSLVHDCSGMGIYTDGKFNNIIGNTVHHASTVNSGLTMTSLYGSGIKVRVGGENILIANNTTYSNYGEGIAVTRAKNVTIRNNVSYDNYVVNIYIDNSRDIVVEKNYSYCTANAFLRDGKTAAGFALGEETYSGTWGAQLSNILVKNNVVTNCRRGVVFFGNESGVNGVNISPSVIANNTFWGITDTAISILYKRDLTFQTGLLIANNIVQSPVNKLIYFDNATGITVNNNFWVGATLPGSTYRGTAYLTGDPKIVGTPDFNVSNYKLQGTSVAIDKGRVVPNVTDDFIGIGRPFGLGFDIGAYEYGGTTNSTPVSTAAPVATSTPITKIGDANNDNIVNDQDYSVWLANYGQSLLGASGGDFNNSGKVDGVDYVIWLNNYGR